MSIPQEHLQLFQSIFKGRTDAFAVRWEKNNKSGYMPAYDLDWNEFNVHKAKGGTFQNFQNKKYQALTSNKILEHLTGKQTIGIYPLLADNTSWFIAADFDEKSWLKDCLSFIQICNSYELPVYLERSRSGNGGHVWIFFEENFPASKSREIVKKLLQEAQLSEHSIGSFDRLFPNQDSHSGAGLGNLIALPLQGNSIQNSNSCFIDSNGIALNDQWKFIESIQKVSTTRLNDLYSSIRIASNTLIDNNQTGLQINISNKITLNRNGISPLLLKYIKEELQFVNQEFLIKKKFKKSTYKTEVSFKLYTETLSDLMLPRGFAGKLIRFCKDNAIPFTLIDQREKQPEIKFSSKIKLRGTQQSSIEVTDKKDMGVIVAPPGSGKTVIALEIISRKQQPALIIVHRQQLQEQWLKQIETFLGIPKQNVGLISGNTKIIGKQITIAMIQSIGNIEVSQKFGVVIVDECHHIPAKTFREAIDKIHSYYLYGLTATPVRKYNDESLIYTYIGDIIVQLEKSEYTERVQEKPLIIVRETDFDLPFNPSTDNQELLLTALVNDTHRNKSIVEDVSREVRIGKQVLILTERKAHIQLLAQYLKTDFELVCVSGEDSKREREDKLRQIHSEDFQILISTGQFLGEGIDIPELDCLFLVFPFSFEGKLIQYIGRLQRGNNKTMVYDYRDKKVDYLDKQFRQRNTYYNKLREPQIIEDGGEYCLFFNEHEAWIDNESNLLQFSQLDLPEWVTGFRKGTCWKIKVIKYNGRSKSMLVEILDYNSDPNTLAENSNVYPNLDKIIFKSIDSKELDRSTLRKKTQLNDSSESRKETFEQTIPFDEIKFDYGFVYFHKHYMM